MSAQVATEKAASNHSVAATATDEEWSNTGIPFDGLGLRRRESGIELEFDGHGGEAVDGLAAPRRRREGPALHGGDGGIVEQLLAAVLSTSTESAAPLESTRSRRTTVPCQPWRTACAGYSGSGLFL